MAVAERTYRRYTGQYTPAWSRFLILPRYAFREVFRSKLFSAFFALCFAAPVFCAVAIYLKHNLGALEALKLSPAMLLDINSRFFLLALTFQAQLAFFLTFLAGPGLISSDLSNNALPLYLCRPLSRAEYVLGKLSVLVILLSLITWIPFLLLFLLQSYLEGARWMAANVRVAGAIFLSSASWILTLSLLALALSAWVRRRAAARLLLVGVFFILAALGAAINALFRTHWGFLIDLSKVTTSVWASLFGLWEMEEVSPGWAWTALAVLCGFCLLLLWRKVRAYEVVA